MTIRPPATRLSSTRFRRRGFSFTEILFAVMILGIGFIMVVAIFPVALQQTENSQAETVGTAVARAGVSYVSQNAATTFVDQSNVTAATPLIDFSILRPTVQFGVTADDYNLHVAAVTARGLPLAPVSSYPELVGSVWSFDSVVGADFAGYVNDLTHTKHLATAQPLPNVLWPMMSQNMIHAADPRYAWVAFYRRNLIQTAAFPNQVYSYAPSAQIIVIALKSQAKQFYDQTDLAMQPVIPGSPYYPTSIQPSLGRSVINPPQNGSLSFTITLNDSVLQTRAAEGAFVIISSDGLSPDAPLAGTLNGHIYKLGGRVSDPNTPNTWEFAPGYGPPLPAGGNIPSDYRFIANNVQRFMVYMVGKAIDPNDKATTPTHYAGQAQDIAAYSTFISCPGN